MAKLRAEALCTPFGLSAPRMQKAISKNATWSASSMSLGVAGSAARCAFADGSEKEKNHPELSGYYVCVPNVRRESENAVPKAIRQPSRMKCGGL